MKHLGRISMRSVHSLREMKSEPVYADAKVDLMNAMWRAWSDFYHQKKNDFLV